VPVRTRGDDGDWAAGFGLVPRGTPGQQILDNWDAVGMGASGSHDVVYENFVAPQELVTVEGSWDEWSEGFLIIATVGNIGILGAFIGIAESAQAHAVALARTRKKAPSGRRMAERSGIQHQVAESEADLATCRALIERIGRLLDHNVLERPPSDVTIDELHELNRELRQARREPKVHRRRRSCPHDFGRCGLYEQQPAVPVVPRRPRRTLHAAVLAQRGIRVRRASRARAPTSPRRLTR
jgi:alkylation response protein AidB-like acyl-CoA dehydrogenase